MGQWWSGGRGAPAPHCLHRSANPAVASAGAGGHLYGARQKKEKGRKARTICTHLDAGHAAQAVQRLVVPSPLLLRLLPPPSVGHDLLSGWAMGQACGSAREEAGGTQSMVRTRAGTTGAGGAHSGEGRLGAGSMQHPAPALQQPLSQRHKKHLIQIHSIAEEHRLRLGLQAGCTVKQGCQWGWQGRSRWQGGVCGGYRQRSSTHAGQQATVWRRSGWLMQGSGRGAPAAAAEAAVAHP